MNLYQYLTQVVVPPPVMEDMFGVTKHKLLDDVEGDFRVCEKCDRVLPIGAYYYHANKQMHDTACKECKLHQQKVLRQIRKLQKQL